MTDIGNPIPRGTIDTDAPLVDEALAAKEDQSSSDAADTVAALKAEIETLRTRIAEHRSDAAAKVRSTVRDRPLVSLTAALLAGYGIALALHGSRSASTGHGWR
ncbi:hypothetical protein G8E10_20345 [Rhizobiaceae bacterium CRRU44]|uniref:Uncharacterized protein n=1 Tax=Ferranicluibacter rubi TaxID=2715133 RepID=A0AA43ZJ81_9HYPH|nr:hypothetical protein [Ferranicluibacter rubi]NHT78056.1 hypothetical protein [Ferranicluibacter rubi]TCP84270.1 hypothetical protein C8J31_10875 [Rhizobium sp. PP-CC-2G-626]